MNKYITSIGTLLPDLTKLILSINSDDYFDKNPKYFAVKEVGEKEKLTTADAVLKTRLLKNINKFARHVHGKKIVDWYQNNIKTSLEIEIKKNLPKFILDQNITFMMQIASQGVFLPIHKDHERKSSLFYLLEGDNYETRWYRQIKKFDNYYSNIIDPACVELDYKICLEKNMWYAFNNDEYHSVHKIHESTDDRISFLIEFVDLKYTDLIDILRQNHILT